MWRLLLSCVAAPAGRAVEVRWRGYCQTVQMLPRQPCAGRTCICTHASVVHCPPPLECCRTLTAAAAPLCWRHRPAHCRMKLSPAGWRSGDRFWCLCGPLDEPVGRLRCPHGLPSPLRPASLGIDSKVRLPVLVRSLAPGPQAPGPQAPPPAGPTTPPPACCRRSASSRPARSTRRMAITAGMDSFEQKLAQLPDASYILFKGGC